LNIQNPEKDQHMNWDKEKIKSVLPQREPFLFIDEVVEIEGTKRVVAIKNIKMMKAFLQGISRAGL